MHQDFSGVTSDEQFVNLWLSGRPESTQKTYRGTATKFLKVLRSSGTGIKEATVADLVTWVEGLHGKERTQARMVSTIKSLLSFAYRTGYTTFNVGRVLKCPKTASDLHERILEVDAVQGLIQSASPGMEKTFVLFVYASGARVSEACGLRFKDIRGNRVTLVRGKGNKTRTIVVPPAIVKSLLALRGDLDEDRSIVFKSKWGTPLQPRTAQMLLKRVSERAGEVATPHYLRHAHATHALENGAPIHVVQRCLGHANVATTSQYLHARPTEGASQFLNLEAM